MKGEICKTEQYNIMNNLETNDLSWQEWFEDEGITVIVSQAPLSEIPWPHIWADLGVGGSIVHVGYGSSGCMMAFFLHSSLFPHHTAATIKVKSQNWT